MAPRVTRSPHGAPGPGLDVFVSTFPERYAGGMEGTLTIR